MTAERIHSPNDYCQERAASSGSSFYYSFLFLNDEQRQAITALYAFCREVDDVVDECSDPTVARAKLEYWRGEIASAFDGTPQHPVTRALQPALARYNLPQEYFQEIIDGMQMDLDYDSYPSFTELSLYCYRVASVVGLMAAEIFGYEDRATLRYANDLGLAFQLTNILRDVHEDVNRGRIYIPLDEMKKFGVSPGDLTLPQTTENLRKLFAFQAERAQNYYDRAFGHLPEGDRWAQRSGIIMAAIYRSTLHEIEKDGFHVLEHRIKLTPLRKLWIAWRTARQEKKRHRRYQRNQGK
ncbi:MAG TPA: squalene synthase HpnD [Thioalkalivibrio sp.]|nr:squalene synthase HpnD [Thioalkalivibrio sp.]